MLNEGIDTVSLDTGGRTRPFQVKKYLKNYLQKNGIKIAEKRTMERGGGFLGRGGGYNNDLFDGYMLSTHHQHLDRSIGIKLHIKGNRMRAGFEWGGTIKWFEEKLGDATVKDFAKFIVKSWREHKQQIESQTEYGPDKKTTESLKDEIENIDVGPFKAQLDVSRNTKQIILRPLSDAFKDVALESKYAIKHKAEILNLLEDPQVKRKLPQADKSLDKRNYFSVPLHYYGMAYETDTVHKAIESLVKAVYGKGLQFTSIDFDFSGIEFKMPRTQDPFDVINTKPSKLARTSPRLLTEKEAIRSAKRLLVEIRQYLAYKEKSFIEMISRSDVSRMMIRRFFKEPDKYL